MKKTSMKKTALLSDAELAAFSKEHLLHELKFLQLTAQKARSQTNEAWRSILVESFGIHLRTLIEFFFYPVPRKYDDDVMAQDYCPAWNRTISTVLADASERAHKELGHLTLERKYGLDRSKPWDTTGLFKEIHDVALCFARKASPLKKLDPSVLKFLEMPRASAIALVMGGPTSNTAA